ncbi:MAG: VWA domain-containing protein [Vulcanisaeta sp.]|uniref:vWA domain-containing protein n=1 Tax=Vulcanisaeta sp. EB80 TaxID=1650660 RepID=UPI000AE7F2C4|nr:VWA domain-containing protein [Vulcanisaeta sp. EB80]MCG2864807.1 VWA domain-containing protein [Vulcanisaeta sp.]MCG2866429.1 VWA domain-containing protein [Vulcanisaeta sp.]MCG2885434.1 VWA domain-containing protein [Vulcanisaeta sp.]MDT7970304.1 VWA domain-containing protein [Vulcanisaeta sp.]
MSINIDPGYIVVRVLSKVYAYLQEDSRVIRPGSVRSFESAVNDIMMRIMLEGGVDYDKFKETVVRVGIENLYLSVETTNPEDKKRVLEEAFERAFEDLETRQSEVGPESLDQQVSGFNVGASDNFENVERGNNDETENTSGSIGGGFGSDLSAEESQDLTIGKTLVANVDERNKDARLDSIISTIYEILYGGVGTVNFLNLAQLINMFIDPYANIVEKVQVLKKMEPYLRNYGLLPTDIRRSREGERVFEALRNVVRNAMSGMGQVKIVRFTDIDKYPTYVVSVREYKIGDNYFDVDLQKTAMNLSRKTMMHKLFTNKDIVVKEYANVKTIDIVLCLDVSGSMRELSNGMPKIEIAKDAVAQYIEFLSKTNDRLAMVLFNFRADVLWSLHQVRRYWQQMNYMLKYVYAGGGTNLANALERSREVLTRSRSSSKHVICVTDGRTVNSSMCIKEAVRLRRGGTTISTIAIGENSDDELLMRLSKIGGGLFIKISSIHDLGKALIMDKLHSM